MDEIDGRLLAALRIDGRARQRTLAEAAGISRAAAGARLARLLAEGTINVVGAVHPFVLGLASLAHLAIELDGPVRPVAEAIARLDEVPFVSITSGPAGLVAELRVRSPESLSATVAHVRGLPGVRVVSTNAYTSLLVDVLRPSGLPASRIDRTDIALLALLQDDGRMPYTVLGAVTGLSASAARARVRHLIDSNVVRIGPLPGAGSGAQELRLGIGVQLAGDGAAAAEAIGAMPAVRFLALTTGRYAAIGTVHATTLPELVGWTDDLRRLPGVVAVDSWMHLDLVKESYRVQLPRVTDDME